MDKKHTFLKIFFFSILFSLYLLTNIAYAKDYGNIGDPINLTIGYQPYYTQSWSGVVMNGKKIWEKYLPRGSKVDFKIGLQGSVIVNNMLANKQDIGYMGDMPAIIATTKDNIRDIRIIANLGMAYDQCNIFFVRNDAPEFNSPKDAIEWLNGKKVAAPKGSCSDRYARATFEKLGIKPAQYLNQNIEVITSGFRAGKIDAAVIWEPTASKITVEKTARRVASGLLIDASDAAFLTAQYSLIEQRPDVIEGWLKAELEAQIFISKQNNSEEVINMVISQTTGFHKEELWKSLYYSYPLNAGGVDIRNIYYFTFTTPVMSLIKEATSFLHKVKSINVKKVREEAILSNLTKKILNEENINAPVVELYGMKSEPDWLLNNH